jgi:hypothetical protein
MELASTLAAAVSALIVPWFAACGVLVVAGVAKLRRPEPTVGALRAAGFPTSTAAVLGLGLGEIALGALGIAAGWRPVAAAVTVIYAAFAGFVVATRRRGGALQTCGCFGSPDVPATGLHVVVNVLAAVVAGFVAVTGDAATLAGVLHEGGRGAVLLGLAALATLEVVVVLAVLPLLQAHRRRPAW